MERRERVVWIVIWINWKLSENVVGVCQNEIGNERRLVNMKRTTRSISLIYYLGCIFINKQSILTRKLFYFFSMLFLCSRYINTNIIILFTSYFTNRIKNWTIKSNILEVYKTNRWVSHFNVGFYILLRRMPITFSVLLFS